LKILILGCNGLIGHSIFNTLSDDTSLKVYGALRRSQLKSFFRQELYNFIFSDFNIYDNSSISSLLIKSEADVVINCVGITKHVSSSNDKSSLIFANSLFPHILYKICKEFNVRLIHISTDCVFSGIKGDYLESDNTDSYDMYGKSKALGEINDVNCLTIRTSTIGHELNTKYGLLEWFLDQSNACYGFSNAIFSGLPTVVLAELLRDIIIPDRRLTGLLHVGSSPITKYDLLCLINDVYKKNISITKIDQPIINRALNTDKFKSLSGFYMDWNHLITKMYNSYKKEHSIV
jgi:dTDP-4-dehydrorhamnose reductase